MLPLERLADKVGDVFWSLTTVDFVHQYALFV